MKPLAVKPNLYTYFMDAMKQIAWDHGYNLVLHGSMNRDLDLIAIPWVDDPKPELDLMNALHAHLNHREDLIKEQFLYNVLPGGRHSYVINLNRGGYRNYGHGVSDNESLGYEQDQQYYIDISVTPLAK